MAMSHLGAFVPSKYFAFIYVRVYICCLGPFFNYPETERLLTAGHPKYPIAIEHTQVDEINVCAVKDNDLARFDSGADFRSANTVGCLCRFDQDKARQ